MSHLPPSSGRRPSQSQAPLPDDGDPAPFITAAMTAKSASKFSSCTRKPSTSSAPATPAATSRRGSLSQAPQAPQPVQQAAQQPQPVQQQPRQQLKHTQSAPKSHSVPPAPRAPPTATAAPSAPVILASKKATTKPPAGPAMPATPTRKPGTPATPGTPRTPTVPAAASSSIPASPSAAGSGVEPRAAPRIPASPLRSISTAPSADAAAVPSVGSTSTKPAASLATTATTTTAAALAPANAPAKVAVTSDSSAKPKIPASPLRRASVTESAPSMSKQSAPTMGVDDSSSAATSAPSKEAAAKPKIPASPLRRTSSVPAAPAPVPAPVPAANVDKIAPKKSASTDVTPPLASQKTAVVDSQVHQGVQPTSSTPPTMSAAPTSTVTTAPESSALKTATVPATKTEVLTKQRAASLLQDVDKILLENDTLRRQLASSKDREATLDTERRDIERKCRMLEALIGTGRGVGASHSAMSSTNPNGQNQSATSSGAGDGRSGTTTASKDTKKGAKKDSASSTKGKGKSKEDEHGSPAQSYALATGRTDAWRSGAPASTAFLSPGSSNMFYHRGTEGTDALGSADAMPGHQYPHSSSDNFLANGQSRHGAGVDDDDEGASYRYIGVLGDERLARVSQELCAAFAFEAVEDLWAQRGELMSAAQDIFSTLTSSASNALSSTFSAAKKTAIEVPSTSLDHDNDSAVKAASASASDVAGVALREALASAQRSISQMDKELGRVKRELSRQTATAAMHAAASRPLATTSTTSTTASSSSPLTSAATDSQRRVKPPLSRPSPPPFSSSPSHRSDSPQSHSAAIARTLSGSSDDIHHDQRHRHDAPHGLSTGTAGEGIRGVGGVAAITASMSYSSSSLSYSSFRQQCLCSYEVLLQSQLSALEDLEAASRQTILEYQTHMAEAMLQSGSDQGTMLHATVTTTSAFHDNAERMAFAWRTNETIATATFFEAELVHRHAIMDQYTQFVEQTATLAAPMWRIDFYREQRLRTLGIPYWKRRETDFDAQNNAEMWEVMTALDAGKNKTGANDSRNGKQKQTPKKGKKSGADKENDPTDVPEAEAFAAAIAEDGVVLARDPYDPGLATYLAACHSHLLIQSKEPELALDADGNPTSSSSTFRTDRQSSSTLLRSISDGTDGGDNVGVVAGATCPSKFSSLYQETPNGRADRALVNAHARDGGALQRYHQHGHGDGDSGDDGEFGEGRNRRRFPPFISHFFSPELDDYARANTATATSSSSLQLRPHEVEVPKNGLSSLSYDPFAQTQIVRVAMIAAAACARGDYSGFSSGYSGGVGGLDAVRELLEITERYKRAIAGFEARDRERDAELQSLRAAAKARLAAKLEKKPPPSVPERPMRIKDPWNHEPPHAGDFTGSQGMFIPRTPSEGGAGSRSPSVGSRTPKAPTTRVYGRGQPIPMGGQSPSADSCSSTPQKSRVAPKLPPRAPPSTRQSPLSPPAQTLTWSGDYSGAGGQGQPLAAYYPPPTSSDDDNATGATSSDNDEDLVFTRDVVDRSPPKKTAPRHDGIDWADEGQMLSVAQVIARAEAAFSAPTPKPSADFHDAVPFGDPAKVAATLRHALRTMRRLETIDAERIRARMAHLEHEQERDLKSIMTGEEVYFAALEFWKKVTVEGQRREDALEALTYRRDRMRTMGYAAVIPRPEVQEMLDQSGVLPTGKDRGGWVLLDFAADGAKHELDPKLFTPIETPTVTSQPSRSSTPVSRSTPIVPTDRPMSRRSSSVDLVPDPAGRGPVHVTTESNIRALQKELTTAHGTIDSLHTRIQKLLAELQTERGEKATLMLASQKASRLEREAADFARAQKAKRAARRSEGVLCESEYDNLALLSGSDHLIRASNRNDDDDDDDDVENNTSQRGPTKFVEIVIRNLGRQADVTWSAVSDAADIAYESLLEQKKAHEAWSKQRAKDRVTEYRYWRMKSLGTNVAVVCRAGTQTEMTSASTSIAAVTEFSTLSIREQEADVPALISQRQQQILNEAAGIDSPPIYECPLASVPNQEAIRKRQQVEEQKKKSFFSFLSRDSKKKQSPSAKPQSGSGQAFADGSVSTRSSGQISSSTEQQCAGMICGACGATVRYNAETHASAFSAYGPVMTPLSMPGAHRFASSAAVPGGTPRHPMMHSYARSSVAASAAGGGAGAGGGKVPMCECGLPLGHVVYFGSASCTGVAETCFAEGAENPTAAVQSGGRPPSSARVGAGAHGLKTPRGMTAVTDDGRGSAQTCSASAVTSGSGGSHGGPSAVVVEPWMAGGGVSAHRRPGPILCVSDDDDAVSRDSVSDSSDASSDRDHDQATSAAATPNKTPATPHSEAPGSTLLKTASGAVFVSNTANHSASKKPLPKPPTFRSNCRGCFDLYAVVGKQHQDLADAVVAQEVAVRHARAAAAQSIDDAKNRAESSVDFSFTAALFEGLEDSIRSALMSHQQSEFEMLCFVDDIGEKMCRELAQVNLRGYQYHRMKSLGFMVDPPLPVYSENVAVQTAIGATGQSDETLEAALTAMDQLKQQLDTAQAKIAGLEAAEQKRIEAGTTVPEAQLAVATKALEQEQARTGILAVQLAEAADRVASAESERLENELRLREATEKLGLVRDQLHLCEGQLQNVRSAEGDELYRTRAEMSELKLQLATISAERDERMDHQAKNIQAFALGTSNIDEVASEAARDLGVARRVIAAVEQDKAQLLDRLSEHERRMVGHARDLYQAKCERDAARDESAGLRRDLVRSQDVSAQLSAQIESLERSVALSESRAAKERTLKAQAVASITDAELKASILASKVSLYEAIDHEALVAARKDYAKLRAKERRIEERKAGRKLGSRAPTAAADADADAAKPALEAEKPGLFRRLFRKKVEDEKLNNAPRSSDDDDDDHHRRDGDTRTNSHVDPSSMVGNESLTAAAAEAIDGAAPSDETPDSAVADEEVCLSPDNTHPTRLVTMHALSAERPETFDPMTLAVARLEDARDEIARLRRKLALTRRKLSEHVDIQASQEGQASLHLQALEAALKASDSARVAAEEELRSARELATVSERQARAAMLKAQVAEQEVNDLLQQAVDQKRTALHGDAHHHANDSGGANSSGELPPGGGANTTEDSLADLSASPSGRSSVASIRGAKLSEKAPRIPLSPTFTAKNAAGAAAGAAGASRHVQHQRPRVPARMNSGVGASGIASGSADRPFAGGDSPPRFPEKDSSLGASLTDGGPATRTTAQHHRRVSSTGLSDRSAGGGGGDVAALRSALETAEQQIQQLRDEQKDRRRKAKVELREEVMRRRRYLARRRGEQQIAVANVAARTHVKIRRAQVEEQGKTTGADAAGGVDARSQRIDEAHAAAGLTALTQRGQTDADASSSKKRHTFSAIPTHGDKPKGPAVPRTPSVRRTSVDANATASAVGNVGSASGNKSDTEGYIQPSKKRKPGTSNANANNATNNDDDETDIASDTAIASDSAISGGSDGGGAGDGSAAERRMHAVPSKPTSRVLGRRVNPPPAATTGAATGAQSNAGAAQVRGRGLQSMSDSEGNDLRLPLPRAVPKTTAEGRVVVGRVPKNKIGSLLRGGKPALAPTGDRSFCSEDEIDLDAEITVDGDTPFEMNTGRLMSGASAASDSDAAGGVGLRGSGSGGGPHALHHIVTSRPQSQAAYEQELRLDDIEADRELVAVRVKEALRQGGPGNSRTMAEQNKDLRSALQELYELHEETFGAARGERLALVEELEAATVQAQVLSHAVRAHVTSQVGYDTPDVATPRSELY